MARKKPSKKVKAAQAAYQRAVKTSKPGEGGRFAAMEKLAKAKGVKSPGGLSAYIGRKKYGKKGMAQMSAAGRKKGRKK